MSNGLGITSACQSCFYLLAFPSEHKYDRKIGCGVQPVTVKRKVQESTVVVLRAFPERTAGKTEGEAAKGTKAALGTQSRMDTH